MSLFLKSNTNLQDFNAISESEFEDNFNQINDLTVIPSNNESPKYICL